MYDDQDLDSRDSNDSIHLLVVSTTPERRTCVHARVPVLPEEDPHVQAGMPCLKINMASAEALRSQAHFLTMAKWWIHTPRRSGWCDPIQQRNFRPRRARAQCGDEVQRMGGGGAPTSVVGLPLALARGRPWRGQVWTEIVPRDCACPALPCPRARFLCFVCLLACVQSGKPVHHNVTRAIPSFSSPFERHLGHAGSASPAVWGSPTNARSCPSPHGRG